MTDSNQDKRPGIIDEHGYYQPPGTILHKPRDLGFLKPLIPIFIIILIVSSIGALVSNLNFADTVYLDSQEYNVAASELPANITAVLDIDLNGISHEIDIVQDLTNSDDLIRIETEVYGVDDTPQRVVDDYLWQTSVGNGEISLILNEDYDRRDYSDYKLQFSHEILVAPGIQINTNINTVSGDVDMILVGSQNDTRHYIETTSGDIYLEAESDFHPEYVSFTAVSGDIVINTESTTVFDELDLEVTSGTIVLDFETSTTFLSSFSISSSSGSVDFDMDNGYFANDLTVDIDVVSGSIDLDWGVVSTDSDVKVYAETVSGSIDAYLDLDTSLSASFSGDTTSGSVNLPGDVTGTSGSIAFYFDTVSGSIYASLT